MVLKVRLTAGVYLSLFPFLVVVVVVLLLLLGYCVSEGLFQRWRPETSFLFTPIVHLLRAW